MKQGAQAQSHAAQTDSVTPTSRRWSIVVLLALVAAIGLVLLFLLTQATGNHELYERNYTRLFIVNAVVALVLLSIILWVAWRLLRHWRLGRFGSRLLLKLALVFVLAGFVPGLLIYVVSYQFVSRSIESWFDVQVEGALEAGLGLGRATLETLSNDLAAKGRAAALQLQESPDASAGLLLERLREQLEVNDMILWSSSGQLLASAGDSRYLLNPERPPPLQLRKVREQEGSLPRTVTWIEGLEEAGVSASNPARIKALALAPHMGLNVLGEARYLMVSQELPLNFVANAQAVAEVHREYQERALARQGLQRMYIGTLTLSLFLAVFGAVLMAVLLGNQITRPLLLLAEGMRQVAAGDLTPKAVLMGRDELGGLTRSFAEMTQQLSDARRAAESGMEQAQAARENLQTILDNLTAGVMVLSDDGVIQTVNPGATRILRLPLAAWEGRKLQDIEGLQEFAHQVLRQFEQFTADRVERSERAPDHWQQSFELRLPDAEQGEGGAEQGAMHPDHPAGRGNVLTLVARGAELPGGLQGAGWLLVFDDISEIVSAQRLQAWGEVARRLAHEIKNPLTPIQLSAERLERKLGGKIDEDERVVLEKSVKTIVDQVDAMKRLVNEFRDYARLPAAELQPLDLNALVQDVLQLYRDAEKTGGVPVQAELDPRCPFIQGDAQQLRQVLHNLLQNAQDATETAGRIAPDPSHPHYPVIVKTEWREARGQVRLVVQDSGTGFPESILKRAFEPYVTTKAKGTGLGLAVVKKIADDHGARITLSNRMEGDEVKGAQVSLSFAHHGEHTGR